MTIQEAAKQTFKQGADPRFPYHCFFSRYWRRQAAMLRLIAYLMPRDMQAASDLMIKLDDAIFNALFESQQN